MNYLLTATRNFEDLGMEVMNVAVFFAGSDTSAQKIARAIVRTLVAENKDTLNRHMFKLYPNREGKKKC